MTDKILQWDINSLKARLESLQKPTAKPTGNKVFNRISTVITYANKRVPRSRWPALLASYASIWCESTCTYIYICGIRLYARVFRYRKDISGSRILMIGYSECTIRKTLIIYSFAAGRRLSSRSPPRQALSSPLFICHIAHRRTHTFHPPHSAIPTNSSVPEENSLNGFIWSAATVVTLGPSPSSTRITSYRFLPLNLDAIRS